MFNNTNGQVPGSLSLGRPCGTSRGESRVKAGSDTGQSGTWAARHARLPSWHGARAGETGPAGPHPSSCQAGKPSAPCSSLPLHVPCPLPRHRRGQPHACQLTSSLTALWALRSARDLGRQLRVLPAIITMIIFVFLAQKSSTLTLLPPGPKPGGAEQGARGAGSILRCQGRGLRGDTGDGAEWRGDPVPPPKGPDWKSTPTWLIH